MALLVQPTLAFEFKFLASLRTVPVKSNLDSHGIYFVKLCNLKMDGILDFDLYLLQSRISKIQRQFELVFLSLPLFCSSHTATKNTSQFYMQI